MTTDVTKYFSAQDVAISSIEGAYVNGLYLQGARLSEKNQILEHAPHKVLEQPLAIIALRILPNRPPDSKDIYLCPVYKTQVSALSVKRFGLRRSAAETRTFSRRP